MSTLRKKIEGVSIRHARGCEHRDGRCTCAPAFQAHVLVRGRRLRKTSSLAAARAWRQDTLSATRRGETVASPSRRTVGDAIADFMAALADGTALKRGNKPYKPSVARLYRDDLGGRVLDRIGHVRLSDLSRSHLQALVAGLTTEGLSASRVRGIVTATQALLRRELRAQRLVTNPALDLDLPALAEPDETVLTTEQVAALVAAAPDSDRAIWAIAGWAGLRRGEIRALRVSDLDIEANELRVSRSWDDREGAVAPKSRRGSRRVPVAPQLRTLLLAHIARTGRRGDDLLCGRTASEPFTPTHVAKTTGKAWAAENAARAKRREEPLPIVGLHRFRHAWISAMLAAGSPVASVALWAGHDVKVMTEVYLHAIPGRGHEDGETIGAVFGARQSRDNARPPLAVLSGR